VQREIYQMISIESRSVMRSANFTVVISLKVEKVEGVYIALRDVACFSLWCCCSWCWWTNCL